MWCIQVSNAGQYIKMSLIYAKMYFSSMSIKTSMISCWKKGGVQENPSGIT